MSDTDAGSTDRGISLMRWRTSESFFLMIGAGLCAARFVLGLENQVNSLPFLNCFRNLNWFRNPSMP